MTQKTTVPITFAKGLDQKSDPWNLAIGSFQSLVNSIFSKGGLLQKIPGRGLLTSQNPNSSYLTTLNDNLISVGTTVNAYSPSLNEWISKGTLEPCSLSVLPLIRNNLNQIQCDSVVSNGTVLTTYTQITMSTSAVVTNYLFVIADSVTGQNICPPTAIPVLSTGAINGSSRVFVVGNFFVIVSPCSISGSTFLQYVSIPILNPVNIVTNAANTSAAQNINSDTYQPISGNPGWDGIVEKNTLVIAYNTLTGTQGVHVTYLLQSDIAANLASTVITAFTDAAYIASILTICVDVTQNTSVFYVSFWNNSTTNGYTFAVTIGFGTITQKFSPQQVISSVAVANLASSAQNNSCLVFSEVTNAYSYDSTVPSNFINAVTVSSVGTVGTPYVSIRSVGLASKSFIINGSIYFLSAFQSTFQPSYFLINGSTTTSASPKIVAKLAYENGGGYLTLGLPSVAINATVASISYLYKDDVEALNTLNNPQQTTAGGIYSQLGINLVNFTIGTQDIGTVEIANNLHITGGYLSHFDGYLPVEHNFFLFPDTDSLVNTTLTYTANSTVTPTGTVATGSFVITAVSSVSGVSPGMTITGTAIPAGAVVVFVGTTTITISLAATGNHSSEMLTIKGNIEAVPSGGVAGSGAYYYQVTYEWTDNQGLPYRSAPSIPVTYTTSGSAATGSVLIQIPTLRLTAKVTNKVKIVIYRWSSFTQVYNQVTSITAPVLNDTTVDSVSFVDTLADVNVVGNNILYTTGGVVPNCNAPSFNALTLFDTRLWGIEAENPNNLWVSKQVIPGVPVEMSQLFTIYAAPNTGTVASTGPLTAFFPMDDKLILYRDGAIYYINGVGPNNLGTTSVGCSLGNYSQATFITSVVGSTNQSSIVLAPNGLMFQSDKGIWMLSRSLQASYIGSPVENFNGSIVNSANVIPDSNYVLFTLNTGEQLMYDYYYEQWGSDVGASAVSSTIYNGLHTILTPYGEILQETPNAYLNNANPVLMSFTTGWINLASLQGYERLYEIYLLGKYLSPHFLNVQIAYDYNDSIVHEVLINPMNFSSSIPSPFGVPTPFGSPGNKEQFRIHAKRQLCESFQLTITEVFNPEFATIAGAGFQMSGISLVVGIKKSTRPIPGRTSVGLS